MEFLRSRNWKDLRLVALDIYGRCCMKCGDDGSKSPINVDHIKPRDKHPKLSLDIRNLQVLCAKCNYVKSNKNENDYRNEGQKALAVKTHSNIGSLIDFKRNEELDEIGDTRDKSFSSYINAKLGMTVTDFSKAIGESLSTLNDRWKSEQGRKRIMDSVYCLYVRRFDEL